MGMALVWLLVVFSLLMSVQAAYTLYLMLYTWDQSATYEAARAPRPFRRAQLSFTALLPARHEEQVIGQTIERVMRTNYPRRLVEAIVVCEAQDTGTIATAQAAIDALAAEGITGARVVTFEDRPINKPHALNKGLAEARNEVVTIFDAEDEIHPDIFNVVNTIMLNENVRVVQSGVQLMNYASTWYSAHNVLEYYFWFKSRLHVHAKNGMTPLGGNTCFFVTELLRQIGGWDDNNLTEDAEIGIRLSAMGERVRVVYDDDYVTREESPADLQSFIRQRTRWNQGFLQTLRKGDWRHMPSFTNRLMALYILAFPFVQAVLGLYVPVSLAMMLRVRLPVLVTLALLLPSYLLIGHYVLTVVGLHEFAETHRLRLPRFWVVTAVRLLVTYFPFQWVLGFAAAKAVWRELRGMTNWEKTAHTGVHRELAPYATVATVWEISPEFGVMQPHPSAEYGQPPLLAPDPPILPVPARVSMWSKRWKYGLAFSWVLGLVGCATALGSLQLGARQMAQAVGQVLPLGLARVSGTSLSDQAKMWSLPLSKQPAADLGGEADPAGYKTRLALLDPPSLGYHHDPLWYIAGGNAGDHHRPGSRIVRRNASVPRVAMGSARSSRRVVAAVYRPTVRSVRPQSAGGRATYRPRAAPVAQSHPPIPAYRPPLVSRPRPQRRSSYHPAPPPVKAKPAPAAPPPGPSAPKSGVAAPPPPNPSVGRQGDAAPPQSSGVPTSGGPVSSAGTTRGNPGAPPPPSPGGSPPQTGGSPPPPSGGNPEPGEGSGGGGGGD